MIAHKILKENCLDQIGYFYYPIKYLNF